MALLEGRVALVTGGARGNGAGIAHGLAEHGADVALADIDGEGASQTAAAISQATGQRAIGLETDLVDATQVEGMVTQTVAELGSVDILVNNAGIFEPAHFMKMTFESWDRTLRVNLTGSMLACQVAAKRMIDAGSGAIINVTSIAAEEAFHGSAAYCASKGGLQMLTRVLALDLAPMGIRVNAIAPGFVKTPMTESLYTSPEAVEYVETLVPQARMGLPADLAGTVVYLASDLSSWVTGSTVVVDGGTTAGVAGWKSS